MKHKILFYIGFCWTLVCVAQVGYSQRPGSYGAKISQAKANALAFSNIDGLFKVNKTAGSRLRTKIKGATYLDYSPQVSKQLIADAPEWLALNIPATAKEVGMVLELQKVPDTFMDYKVTTSQGVTYQRNATAKQVHYRGIVKGKEGSSLVALSVFDGEVMGFISLEGRKTLNIAKLKGEEQHAIYYDEDLGPISEDTGCLTSSDHQNPMLDEIYSKLNNPQNLRTKSVGKCLKVYFETDYGIYQNLSSSVTNVENFVTGIFNEAATLYANDGVNMEISEIFVWTTADSYSSSASTGLSQFVAARPTFNGDLAQLLSYRNGTSDPNNLSNAGGIANGIGGMCVTGNSNLSGHSHTVLFPQFVTVPTFSRQVKVVTHEMGHNLGSRHTHACVWNGTNTAIDGCGTCQESAAIPVTSCTACPRPPVPVGGGTIMSYCDRTTEGIDFNLGFGPQPTAVIQNFISSATCVDACSGCVPDLVITSNVTSGQTDNEEASNSITATNTVTNGGTANYQAGNFILLQPGFHSQTGSNTTLIIAACSSSSDIVGPGTNTQISSNQSGINTSDEVLERKDVTLYPNPTGGKFNVLIPTQKGEGLQILEVKNLMGIQVLKQEVSSGQSVVVDLTNLPKGLYLVKYTANGQIMIKKVVYK